MTHYVAYSRFIQLDTFINNKIVDESEMKEYKIYKREHKKKTKNGGGSGDSACRVFEATTKEQPKVYCNA